MLPEYFAVIGAAVASIGGVYYLYETITGKSQPNRVTWLLWGIFPLITFVAQRAQGIEGLSWVSFIAGFVPLLVFGASFINKKAYWKSRPFDYYLMVAAFVGIGLWAITDSPNIAIAFALLADLLAAIPTIAKTYKHPQTESWIAYGISAFGFLLGILTITEFSFQAAAFIIYLFIVNLLLALLAVRKPTAPPLHIEG